jgi:uncharacterized membrane protein YqjE
MGAGAAFMGASLVAWILIFALIGLLIYPALLIWAMIDSYRAVEAHNRRLLYGGAGWG